MAKKVAKKMAKLPKHAPPARGSHINIGISEADRAAIAGGLSHLLADTYTLYLTRTISTGT